MPRHPAKALRCPTCRSLVTRTDPEFPFCSERCRLVDLGRWASGGYVISTAITDPEALENLPQQNQPNEVDGEDHDKHRR
jgi:endogenous inhibitor of DNA gyrase (YacG/DUF329 family)